MSAQEQSLSDKNGSRRETVCTLSIDFDCIEAGLLDEQALVRPATPHKQCPVVQAQAEATTCHLLGCKAIQEDDRIAESLSLVRSQSAYIRHRFPVRARYDDL